MGKIYAQGDMRMKLSCLILTKNNAKTLEYALRSIHKYADEIVLLDSGSADDTLQIARRYTDKIFFREFDGDFGRQKNYGIQQCKGEWIFILDSDELVGQNFYRCLAYLHEPYRSIALPRCHIIDVQGMKQLITPTHYYDWQTRFILNDGKAYYGNKRVHEALQGNTPRLHCCEAHIFHLDFLVNGYDKRKQKSAYYDGIAAGAGFPTMYLPEDYPYHTMTMLELPEKGILQELQHEKGFCAYEWHESRLIYIRESCKWHLRQMLTRARNYLRI